MRCAISLFSLFLWGASASGALAQAAPPRVAADSLPVGEYATFQRDSTLRSLDPNWVRNAGQRSARLVRRGPGWADVFSEVAKVAVRVPRGWQTTQTLSELHVWEPGTSVRLVHGWVSYAAQADSFAAFQSEEFSRLYPVRPGNHRPEGGVRAFTLPDGGFALEERGVLRGGERVSILTVYSPSRVRPRMALRMRMITPADQYETYLPLAGLMVRDRIYEPSGPFRVGRDLP